MSDSQCNAYVTGHPVCVSGLVKILGHKSLMFDFSQIFLSLIQLQMYLKRKNMYNN